MTNKFPWHEVQPVRHSSVVGGGAILLNKEGRCIGQVMVIGAGLLRPELEEAVTVALIAATSLNDTGVTTKVTCGHPNCPGPRVCNSLQDCSQYQSSDEATGENNG